MTPRTETLLQNLVRCRWLLLAAAAILAAAAWLPARDVAFDRSLENMFAEDDPLLVAYHKLKRTFGGNEIALLVYRDDVFAEGGAGIRRLAQVSQRVERIPGVKGVLSLDRIMGEEIVDPNSRLAQEQRKLFENLTHSPDGRIAAIVTMLIPQDETSVPRRETIEGLRSLATELPSGMIAGEPVMISDGFHYVEEDGRRLGAWSTALLAAVIVLCFRSLRWVLIPVVVVQLALLLTRAALVISGLRLSMVSSMLTAIVTVVGIATVVHVIVRFRELRDEGRSPEDALVACGVLLASPIVWSCLTDAAGFGSLRLARVGPVQDFGVMMAIGALMVMIAVPLAVPGLAILGRRDIDPGRVWGERAFARSLQRIAQAASRRPYALGVPLLAISLLTAAGAARLEVESDFTKNFRPGSPIVESYQFVESNLGGAGVWDVLIPVEASLSWEDLQRVLRFEERLRAEVVLADQNGNPKPALTKVVSLADAVQAANAASPVSLDRIPAVLRQGLIDAALSEMRGRMPVFYSALIAPQAPGAESRYLRVMLRASERQSSSEKRRIIEQVEKIAAEEFPGAEVTGFFVLLTHLIDSIIQDQWWTFAFATGAIFLMMAYVFRSLPLALISLVPNVLPIMMVMGAMGWLADFGFKINMGSAMIAAVSIGMSIDSSIHYVLSFLRGRDSGMPPADALARTQESVGLAASFATLALIAGFGVLATSMFVPTIYFGVLVSLAMLGGLLGNLVMLPILLTIWGRAGRSSDLSEMVDLPIRDSL
jgi:predicted RND superfamily exporter protein